MEEEEGEEEKLEEEYEDMPEEEDPEEDEELEPSKEGECFSLEAMFESVDPKSKAERTEPGAEPEPEDQPSPKETVKSKFFEIEVTKQQESTFMKSFSELVDECKQEDIFSPSKPQAEVVQ